MPEKVRTRSGEEDLAIINNGQIQTKKQFIENLPIRE